MESSASQPCQQPTEQVPPQIGVPARPPSWIAGKTRKIRRNLTPGMAPLPKAELKQLGVRNTEELWQRAGREGVPDLARNLGLSEAALLNLFEKQVLWEITKRQLGASVSDTELARVERDARVRQGIVWLLAVLVVAVALLAAGAGVYLSYAGRTAVLVAARDLPAGRVLRGADSLVEQRLGDADGTCRPPFDVAGLVAASSIPRGHPIPRQALLSPQFVATRDLAPGEVVTRDLISVQWLPYDADAASEPHRTIGKIALRGLRKGSVVLTEALSPASALSPEVVVRRKEGLPAGYVVRPEDVDLRRMPRSEGTYNSAVGVVGRRTLEFVPPGQPVLAQQLAGQYPLPGAGAPDVSELRRLGIRTVGDLARQDPRVLRRSLAAKPAPGRYPSPPSYERLRAWILRARAVSQTQTWSDPTGTGQPAQPRQLPYGPGLTSGSTILP